MTEHHNGLNPAALTAAMMTTEGDVSLPPRVRTGSITGCLISLKQGDVHTVSREVSVDETLGGLQANLDLLRSKARSGINACIRNAAKHHGQAFSMESAVVCYPSGRMFIQVTVTCTDGGNDK